MKKVSLQHIQFLDFNFQQTINREYPEFKNRRYEIFVDNVCPICNFSIDMTSNNSVNYNDINSLEQQQCNILSIHWCPHCSRGFVVEHHMIAHEEILGVYGTDINYVECSQSVFPTRVDNLTIDENIRQISPRFYEVYKQCLKAKKSGLNELYGMGFRKALEFLVKDFAISENSAERCNIVSTSLHNCIEKYFKDSEAKTGLLACKWIGNNETHYINSNDKEDLQLLEELIDDTLYYIHRELRRKQAVKINNNKGQKLKS